MSVIVLTDPKVFDGVPPMQYSSGYVLDLYCDACYGPSNTDPAQFTGETFAECAREARRDGWSIFRKTRTARCPDCAVTYGRKPRPAVFAPD